MSQIPYPIYGLERIQVRLARLLSKKHFQADDAQRTLKEEATRAMGFDFARQNGMTLGLGDEYLTEKGRETIMRLMQNDVHEPDLPESKSNRQ